jgi:hypothetical protein
MLKENVPDLRDRTGGGLVQPFACPEIPLF